jgi:hypothetical protein
MERKVWMHKSIRAERFFIVALLLVAPLRMLAQQQIRPPLHTSGHQILDSAGHVVRLASVNWYGFDQKEYVPGGLVHAPLAAIIGQIQAIGVNSVRLSYRASLDCFVVSAVAIVLLGVLKS